MKLWHPCHHAIAVFACADAEDILPAKIFIKASEPEALVVLELEAKVMAQLEQARTDSEGLFHVLYIKKLAL